MTEDAIRAGKTWSPRHTATATTPSALPGLLCGAGVGLMVLGCLLFIMAVVRMGPLIGKDAAVMDVLLIVAAGITGLASTIILGLLAIAAGKLMATQHRTVTEVRLLILKLWLTEADDIDESLAQPEAADDIAPDAFNQLATDAGDTDEPPA